MTIAPAFFTEIETQRVAASGTLASATADGDLVGAELALRRLDELGELAIRVSQDAVGR